MPKGRITHFEESGSLGEQLLGKGDRKRSTKTFIEDGSLAIFLGILRSHYSMVVNVGKQLHAEENGMKVVDVTDEIIADTYPEPLEIAELHQFIIEHKGSQEGFLVDRFTRNTSQENLEKQEKEKTGSADSSSGSKRWS